MIVDTKYLEQKLAGYSNKRNKIRRMVLSGELIKVKRGLYETDFNTPGYLLAGVIYGTSYLSFNYVLALHDLIPERVTVYTSATSGKNRTKMFDTPFGYYSYRDVPKAAFPAGVRWKQENGMSYLIATPEKALCDQLYAIRPVEKIGDLESLLFEDMRIDEDDFWNLDLDLMSNLAKLYHRKNLNILTRYIERSEFYGVCSN